VRYEFFRRRIAPILFLVVLGLIAYDACSKHERTHATIVLDLGDAASDVRRVGVELIVAGEVIGNYQRRALPGSTVGPCPCQFEAALTEDVAQLRIEVDIDGKVRTIERTIRPLEGSTVTVPLGAELQRP
jgi:hypothetical protein